MYELYESNRELFILSFGQQNLLNLEVFSKIANIQLTAKLLNSCLVFFRNAIQLNFYGGFLFSKYILDSVWHFVAIQLFCIFFLLVNNFWFKKLILKKIINSFLGLCLVLEWAFFFAHIQRFMSVKNIVIRGLLGSKKDLTLYSLWSPLFCNSEITFEFTEKQITHYFSYVLYSRLGDWGNHPLTWVNGICFIFIFFWLTFTFSVEPTKDLKSKKNNLSFAGWILIYLLLNVYTWTQYVTIWLVCIEFINLTILYLILKPQTKPFTFIIEQFKSSAPFYSKEFVVLLATMFDVACYFSLKPHSYVKFFLTLFLFLWMFNWLSVFVNWSMRSHPLVSMHLFTVAIGVLFSFIVKVYMFANLEYLFYLSAFNCFYWIIKFGRLILQTPLRAPEQHRKITMFEPAPVYEHPTTSFGPILYNDNVFFLIFVYVALAWQFILFISISTQIYSAITFFLLSLLLFFFTIGMYYCGFQVSVAIKSRKLLNWRGLFLAFHQYNWITKNVWILGFLFNAYLIIYFFIIFFFLDILEITNYIDNFLILAAFLWFLGISFYFVAIWSQTTTYIQNFAPYFWNDNFWPLLSPYLRDLVYWEPIRPDSYVYPIPEYFGLSYKLTFNKVLWSCNLLFFYSNCLILCLFNNLNFFVWTFLYLKLAFAYISYFIYGLHREYTPVEEQNIRNYFFFESLTHVVFLIGTIVMVWAVISYFKRGVLMFIFYWIWHF